MNRITDANYYPEYEACEGCEYHGEPNGCNREGGECDAYSMFVSAYEKLRGLEDKIERGEMVEVVKCRDCEHGKPLPEKHRHEFAEGVLDCYCRRADPDIHDICAVWPDGYCDEAERKEDA